MNLMDKINLKRIVIIIVRIIMQKKFLKGKKNNKSIVFMKIL